MRHSYVPVELMIIILMMLVRRNNCATETTKSPYRITVEGRMMCGTKGAYAVLLNTFEEVKYIKYGNMEKGILRTSAFFLSERNGEFSVQGTRYATDHKIYLNITHHCVPNDKRDIQKNCFMQVIHEIKADPRTVLYDLHDVGLETAHYQSPEVKCIDWPYKYPKFHKTVRDDL
ncbi:unnamed protein product [Wuchereria bancrofti]|uniref:Transthyretin-like family protein n=1 Tax=Wuchereria bancrofti TaxID=6293 RepID=A0A3P7E8V2_WUCBA|nr:unnamed protein product [Wuchereria bancrofti]